MQFENDKARFDFMRDRLYSAVLSDSLDEGGYRSQAMNERIRPVMGGMVVVGRARTAKWADVHFRRDNPYENEISLLDSLKPNEVSVHDTGESRQAAPWGELLSTAARMRGSTGAIVDGLIRDTRRIVEMGFPVFCTGYRSIDSAGRAEVITIDEPVCCGGVIVHSGDVVFGDIDGVVIIPAAVVDEVIDKAYQKVTGENNTRRELLEGKLLREVYEKYGVL
jgi:4-hydroxy-4-methyl-2-oxoglutarate aldolase